MVAPLVGPRRPLAGPEYVIAPGPAAGEAMRRRIESSAWGRDHTESTASPFDRRWQIGLRAQVQSGRPLTTTSGLASARTNSFVRFDMRVDKTAVWNSWLLDFYVDTYHWPAFNVADSAIVLGCLLLITDVLNQRAEAETS